MTQTQTDFENYILISGPYTLSEMNMMTPVINDLRRGGTAYKLKQTKKGTEIWRHKRGYKFIEEDEP